ncbi:hypothetical protein LTR85_008108 [Meristemomyces frigidus]|nr:hypothetical protein LTR85_008108 [Meristemomyces frigidus]
MGKRSFEELSVVATGVQSFEGRFGKKRRYDYDESNVPPISQWRCNLTGLSQEHNLYFVAYGTDIYVYVPQFPSQSVSGEPVLIVPSQPTSSGLRGYLDPAEPHSINNLLIQRLGNEEVVATVRDDGDVDALLVRHVVQAVERRAEPGSTIGAVADEVRPIFQSNVGISAWGLAIHSQARILATSSNAHEVRVFKFGLLHDNEGGQEGPEAGRSASPQRNAEGRGQRQMDVTQRVLNGDANIPNIAFCNTGDDPEARWLLTTDVSGYCRVMDLHSAQDADVTVQRFRFGRSFMSPLAGFDRINAGWSIMFLDTRSFQPERNFQAAVGLADDGGLPGGQAMNVTWDLSDTVDLLAENSPALKRRKRRTEASQSGRRQASEPIAIQGADPNPAADPVQDEVTMQDIGVDTDDSQYAAQALMVSQMEVQGSGQLDDTMMDEDVTSDSEEDLADHPFAFVNEDDPEDEGTEDSVSFSAIYGGKRIFGNQPYFFHEKGLCDDLPCPILHASVKNVYLLQPSKQKYAAGAFSPPMVGMSNPLRQSIHGHLAYLEMFDRLNMTAYIPTLGLVVIASQKGRAMILSLTKLSRWARYPAEMQGERRKTNYAMRLDCILPFASQEEESARPFAPLHGIATAPVQGAGHKRWRLMMMYQDHSILSYEISRPRARDSVVDVAGLVV